MVISDLNYLEVIFKESNILGGSARALAQATASARGPKNAYAVTATRTQADSLAGKSSSESNSRAFAN